MPMAAPITAETMCRATVSLYDDAPLWSSDLPNDPRVEKPLDRESVVREGLGSLIAVPLRAKGRAFGILTFTSTRPGRYDESRVAVAQQIADQIAPWRVRGRQG